MTTEQMIEILNNIETEGGGTDPAELDPFKNPFKEREEIVKMCKEKVAQRDAYWERTRGQWRQPTLLDGEGRFAVAILKVLGEEVR